MIFSKIRKKNRQTRKDVFPYRTQVCEQTANRKANPNRVLLIASEPGTADRFREQCCLLMKPATASHTGTVCTCSLGQRGFGGSECPLYKPLFLLSYAGECGPTASCIRHYLFRSKSKSIPCKYTRTEIQYLSKLLIEQHKVG